MPPPMVKGSSSFRTACLLSFSLPYLLSYFLQTLYGMADLLIIGQFNGVESTTAVSVGSQFMHMLTVMLVGLAMGSTIIIGRAVKVIQHNICRAGGRNKVHGAFRIPHAAKNGADNIISRDKRDTDKADGEIGSGSGRYPSCGRLF